MLVILSFVGHLLSLAMSETIDSWKRKGMFPSLLLKEISLSHSFWNILSWNTAPILHSHSHFPRSLFFYPLFAFWSSPHLSYSLTPLPLTYPPHTFFSDVVVGCLELNLHRHQSQRKFKSSNYSHVPFFEVSFYVFFFLSLHKPEDCPQTAASVAMETTASEATKAPLDLPVPLAFQVRMREMRYFQSTCRPYQIRSQGWTSVIWDHLCMIQSLRMENPKESGVGNWVYWVHEVEVYKM